MKSPAWLKEELLLALELYLSKDLSWLSKMTDRTEEVIQLSKLLNSLSLHSDPKPEKFRSTGSIRMKLSNFKALDERYGKSSLTNLAKADIEIWNEYHNDINLVREKCVEIVRKYLNGQTSTEIQDYLKRFSFINNSANYSNDFASFARETYEKATHYLNESDSSEIESTCKKLLLILDEYKNFMVNTAESAPELHGGINLVPVHSSEIKIGKYVRSMMESMIYGNTINEQLLILLTDTEWSKTTLHLGHPFFIEVDISNDIRKQTRDVNGYQRYWTTPYEICGKHYCMCKEWYESQRKHFDRWIGNISNSFNAGISESQFVKVLEYIKKADSTQVFIERSDLFEKVPELSEKEQKELLRKFISAGLLTGIDGSEHELMVEDYDLLYQMLDNPKLYL